MKIPAAGADQLIIAGQAILGLHPDAPEDLLASRDADLYPLGNPEAADLIDGSIRSRRVGAPRDDRKTGPATPPLP